MCDLDYIRSYICHLRVYSIDSQSYPSESSVLYLASSSATAIARIDKPHLVPSIAQFGLISYQAQYHPSESWAYTVTNVPFDRTIACLANPVQPSPSMLYGGLNLGVSAHVRHESARNIPFTRNAQQRGSLDEYLIADISDSIPSRQQRLTMPCGSMDASANCLSSPRNSISMPAAGGPTCICSSKGTSW